LREGYDATRFGFYTPTELALLVSHAADEQDGAVFLTAAFTRLRRGELVALRWRDVDFPAAAIRVWESYAKGALTTPKSGRSRVVPMVPDVAAALTRLKQRERLTADNDLMFPGPAEGISMRPLCDASMYGPRRWLSSGSCVSTIYATRLDRSRSTARRSFRCKVGWAIPMSTRPAGTSGASGNVRRVEDRA
jgi:integrase